MARWLLAIGLMLLVLVPDAAHAHAGSTKHVEAEIVPGGARLRVELDAADARRELGPELGARGDLLRAWLSRGLSVRTSRGACIPSATAPSFGPRVSVVIAYDCNGSSDDAVLRDDTAFDLDPLHETVVTVMSGGERRTTLLGAGSARDVALAAPATATKTAVVFLREGAHHLVTGYDHLLFLLALMLGALPIVREQGRRAALLRIAGIVTAFTAGHSLTLAAAALGWVTLPGALVETAIAASIVLVAALNLTRRPDASLERPAIALAFGLVHGFGFSSVLADAGLPRGQLVLSLVSFNLGIELAQLALVAVLLIPLAWLATQSFYRRSILQAGSAVIGALACVWMVERALGA